MSLCGYACSFKNLPRSHPTGAVRRVTTANPLELLSSPLMMETIARQSSHRFRRAFHSISHPARVWFLGGLVFCRIAVAVVVVCVEPRGPASPIGVLDIQMTPGRTAPFAWTVSSRKFVPHHRDEGVSATRSALLLSHLLPVASLLRGTHPAHAARRARAPAASTPHAPGHHSPRRTCLWPP